MNHPVLLLVQHWGVEERDSEHAGEPVCVGIVSSHDDLAAPLGDELVDLIGLGVVDGLLWPYNCK